MTSVAATARTLDECEAVIEHGLGTFVEVGAALAEVRDAGLYRETHATFEGYCGQRWSLSRPRAYELIAAAEVTERVSAIADTPVPANEGQARALAPLRAEPEQAAKAMRQASATTNHGLARQGLARLGTARQERRGVARRGGARPGQAGRGEAGVARPGKARHGEARQGAARQQRTGAARRGRAGFGQPGQGTPGMARQGWVRQGSTGRGAPRQGNSRQQWHGQAGQGAAGRGRNGGARCGRARRGAARPGWARRGTPGMAPPAATRLRAVERVFAHPGSRLPMTVKTNGDSTATAEAPSVSIRRLSRVVFEVPIRGTAPLIVNRWSEKAKAMMLSAQQTKARAKKDPKDPVANFEASRYRMPDGGDGFPAPAFKAAIVHAARLFDGITQVMVKQTVTVIGEGPDQLVPIEYASMRMREDTPRNASGVADLRYRAEFSDWTALLRVRTIGGQFDLESVFALTDAAGIGGVGEWRPTSPKSATGTYGTFEVVEG